MGKICLKNPQPGCDVAQRIEWGRLDNVLAQRKAFESYKLGIVLGASVFGTPFASTKMQV